MFGKRPEGYDGVMDAPSPTPIVLTPVDLTTISAEYVARPPDLIIHISRLGEWYWHNADSQIIWDQIIAGFRLKGFENRLLVEFIPEAYGWCVTISDITAISVPKHERIEGIIKKIEEGVTARRGATGA